MSKNLDTKAWRIFERKNVTAETAAVPLSYRRGYRVPPENSVLFLSALRRIMCPRSCTFTRWEHGIGLTPKDSCTVHLGRPRLADGCASEGWFKQQRRRRQAGPGESRLCPMCLNRKDKIVVAALAAGGERACRTSSTP